jgi:hypothetical protein
MFKQIKEFFTGKRAEEAKVEVPYKVEAKSFEDTSDIAIAQRPTPVAEQATQAVVESIAPAKKPVAKKAPAKKAPAAKKPRTPKAAK